MDCVDGGEGRQRDSGEDEIEGLWLSIKVYEWVSRGLQKKTCLSLEKAICMYTNTCTSRMHRSGTWD